MRARKSFTFAARAEGMECGKKLLSEKAASRAAGGRDRSMNRKGTQSDRAAPSTPTATRERQPSRALDGSPSSLESALSRESPSSSGNATSGGANGGGAASTANVNAQFIAIRSRVGKRFQATLPELREKPARVADDESDRARKMLKVMHLSKARYSLDRANALGGDLEKYLKLARSLRDGSTFDTEEQITCLALQYLHRFEYNTTDAACSLYARHSMEVPKHVMPATEATASTRANNPAELEAQWIATFYQIMRLERITMDDYGEMAQLLAKAASSGIAATELGVLERQVNRLTKWLTCFEDVKGREVDRVELEDLVHTAEDLLFESQHKLEAEMRMRHFDVAYGRLKDAFDRNNRRNQGKCDLSELEELHGAVVSVRVNYPEKAEFTRILEEAQEMKNTIMTMLAEDKVNLTAMRDLIAKIELIPVNFEKEVELFQQKMLSAQSWLAKVRKCIPKRRTSRRGGPEPKKMDLQAIRALVDDAPCDDSAEMYEMQDLLECADEWADKVKEAIEGGADVSLDELKELREEGNAMPVDMEEQKFLEAEIAAREWCSNAAVMLAAKKPFQELEEVVDEAKNIRKQLHTKKQSRWKPQIERDIQAALDTARRWINEIRDVVGHQTFEKIFSSGLSHGVLASLDSTSVMEGSTSTSDRSKATELFMKGKKPVDALHRLLEKAERLVVNVDFYTKRLEEILTITAEVQKSALNILVKIGARTNSATEAVEPNTDKRAEDTEDEPMPTVPSTYNEYPVPTAKPAGNFSHACSILDKIASLPVVFDEAVELFEIVHGEKLWAERVREAIPPRQSRKKRMSKHWTTLDDLRSLQEESHRLRFHFPEEIRILSRELEDLAIWQQKAIEVVAGRAPEAVDVVGMSLKSHDMMIFSRVSEAKKKLMKGDKDAGSAGESGADYATNMPNVKSESKDPPANQADSGFGFSERGERDSLATSSPDQNEVVGENSEASSKSEMPPVVDPPGPFVAEPFKVDDIVDIIRREAGCPKKTSEEGSEDAADDEHKKCARSFSVLDPLLTLVEESVALVNAVETKDDKKKLDELLATSATQDEVSRSVDTPDDAVKQLEQWREQISQTLDEGSLFNAVAPELNGLSVALEILEWLQSARSIFYNESLPIKDLVVKGSELESRLDAMRAEFTTFDDRTIDLLRKLLWPLPYLLMHDRVVQDWRTRVTKAMEDNHAPIDEIQKLLGEAYSLLLEPESFKIILDELKKAKLWLAKLKKRLKGLMTKQVNRLTMAVAKALVEEGDEIAIELPAFDMLKEHVELAVDWEKRVLASGLENGQARIATLISLLDEYENARLVIDLDMHRDVLKSATERYCVCRQPYDGFMIGCDYCDDWFHDNCIGMSKEKAEKVENYTCPSCSILHELKSALLRAVESQPTLWTDNDYGKSYEKQHAATQRKIKREEKAVERSEMLLFSCNNHMNQLRARIDDIERAKSCFTTLKNPFEAAAAALPSPTTSSADGNSRSTSEQGAGMAASTTNVPVSLAVTLPIATSSAPLSTSSSTTPAIPNVPMDTLAFVQRYPNILLPSAKFGVVQGDATRQQTVGHEVKPTGATATPPTAAIPAAAVSSLLVSQQGVKSSDTAPNGTPASKEKAVVAVPQPPTVPDMMPSMLGPMLAKLSENRERLSALLVAGGVEQQLAKMKSEHAELKAQVDELQVMIRIGKERLAATQATLDELKRAYVIRQHGLPRAKTWIHRVIRLINAPTSLQRQKFVSQTAASDDLCFLSPEFTEVLTDAKAMEIAHFPEVKVYETLLRAVGWALVTVSLLQERPSRETLMEAIVYANEHHLIDPAKAVAPLRSIIGRVDVWITKAHKTLSKQANQTQKTSRLKALLNEYSKLPLTCSWVSTLEEYMTALEAPGSLPAEEQLRRQTELEAAAVGAIYAASTTWLPAPNPKIQRKRKPYNKRDKSDGGVEGESAGTPEAKAKKAKTGKAPSNAATPAHINEEPDKEQNPPSHGEADDVEMADGHTSS